tara:strand:- start:1462 stop:1743 length:282 start_codon:yes stop_codon:yes gene_type:complete
LTDKKGTLEGLPLVSKLALVFFIIGNALSFMAFFTFFVDLELAKLILIMYTGSIALSVVLALYQMPSNEEEEKMPSKEQVAMWAKEYKLIEGN